MVKTAERNNSTYAYATHTYSGAIVDVPVFSQNSSISSCEPPSTTATIGSFTRDPIGFEGSDWNLYEYVSGKPLHVVDPFGLQDSVPTGSFGELLGGLIGDVSGLMGQLGNITGGPCGSFDWNFNAKGWVSWVGFWKNVASAKRGITPFANCPAGSRCCPIIDQQFWITGTVKGTIKNVRIQGWWLQPDVSFSFTFNANEHLIIGICIKNNCPCPPTIVSNVVKNLGIIDLGTISYPLAPFPAIPPP